MKRIQFVKQCLTLSISLLIKVYFGYLSWWVIVFAKALKNVLIDFQNFLKKLDCPAPSCQIIINTCMCNDSKLANRLSKLIIYNVMDNQILVFTQLQNRLLFLYFDTEKSKGWKCFLDWLSDYFSFLWLLFQQCCHRICFWCSYR